MMHSLGAVLLALLLAMPAGAADAPEPRDEAPSRGEATREARPAEAETAPRPAPGFTPSERISADSAVAFPVDI